MIYDFTEGSLANLLKEEFLKEVEAKSQLQYKPITITDIERLKKIGDAYYLIRGQHIYHMFSYKAKFYIQKYGRLPVYHIADCDTIKQYDGFVFSSEMPVDVYCLDQKKELGKHNLRLCKNCKASLSLFSLFSGDKTWYETILELATKMSKRGYEEGWIKTDGYTSDWTQISMAVRLRDGMRCTQCQQQFTNNNRYFLEVHHIDAVKQNNRDKNLKSLCVKCHSEVDDRHRTNFASEASQSKLKAYAKWLNA